MKRQWQKKRTVKESPDGQQRWDQAYLLILEMTRSIEQTKNQPKVEVNDASSDICQSIDPATSTNPDH